MGLNGQRKSASENMINGRPICQLNCTNRYLKVHWQFSIVEFAGRKYPRRLGKHIEIGLRAIQSWRCPALNTFRRRTLSGSNSINAKKGDVAVPDQRRSPVANWLWNCIVVIEGSYPASSRHGGQRLANAPNCGVPAQMPNVHEQHADRLGCWPKRGANRRWGTKSVRQRRSLCVVVPAAVILPACSLPVATRGCARPANQVFWT